MKLGRITEKMVLGLIIGACRDGQMGIKGTKTWMGKRFFIQDGYIFVQTVWSMKYFCKFVANF